MSQINSLFLAVHTCLIYATDYMLSNWVAKFTGGSIFTVNGYLTFSAPFVSLNGQHSHNRGHVDRDRDRGTNQNERSFIVLKTFGLDSIFILAIRKVFLPLTFIIKPILALVPTFIFHKDNSITPCRLTCHCNPCTSGIFVCRETYCHLVYHFLIR